MLFPAVVLHPGHGFQLIQPMITLAVFQLKETKEMDADKQQVNNTINSHMRIAPHALVYYD